MISITAAASRKSAKKGNKFTRGKNDLNPQNDETTTVSVDGDYRVLNSSTNFDSVKNEDTLASSATEKVAVTVPSKSSVLEACVTTSGLIALLGVVIRQVSHVAASEGLPVSDCNAQVSFGFETWHLELITGLVVLVSSLRFVLLKTWPYFAESSEAANTQVLTSLEPFDYIIVAFLPGISEELLFRGALLPLFGLNWGSALVVGSIFGALHLGNGRKYSFAAWATFVGFAYGYATILSSSVIVPIASHAVNNLVGALLWRYTTCKSNQKLSD